MTKEVLLQSLKDHLAQWGLRRFTSDELYFQWQRQVLSPEELSTLHKHVGNKRRGTPADEVAFYDAMAHPRILPVLFSQRYDYYLAVGPLVAADIGDARNLLDFGCGVGILTTFYARLFPHTTFLGIDRSSASVARAQEQADSLGLKNVRFDCLDIEQQPLAGSFDCIVATHALVQAEQDPGVPSRDWTTFERSDDGGQQRRFEERTGIGRRLDQLCAALAEQGRMIVFEKTRPLARRVPFQRALAARGLWPAARPEPIGYRLVEEITADGPLYRLQCGGGQAIAWDELPEPDEGRSFDPSTIALSMPHSDEPLYENHHPSAQQAWQRLSHRSVVKEQTRTEPDGRQLHVELGRWMKGSYLYCANTFDQRQLVLFDSSRASTLDAYYQEIIGG